MSWITRGRRRRSVAKEEHGRHFDQGRFPCWSWECNIFLSLQGINQVDPEKARRRSSRASFCNLHGVRRTMYKSGLDFVFLLSLLSQSPRLVLNSHEGSGIIINIRRPVSISQDLNTQNIEYILSIVPRLHRDDH